MSEEDGEEEIHEAQVLNAPETIWLVVGELDGDDVDFHECEEIKWCDTAQFKDDIRYTRATPLTDAAPDLFAACQTTTMMLKNLGGMLPGVSEILDLFVEQNEAAIKKARGEE